MKNWAAPLGGFMVIAASVAATGCALLSPQPDISRFFVLTSARSQGTTPVGPPATPGLVYGLGPVKLPAYLDRNAVATRVSPTEVRYSTTDLWSEPLISNITRVLLEDLSNALGTDRIVVFPWVGTTPVDYQVQVEFLRFEGTASGENHLAARWAIRDVRRGRILTIKESTITRRSSGGTPESVAALSEAVTALSEEIAAALRPLPPPEK